MQEAVYCYDITIRISYIQREEGEENQPRQISILYRKVKDKSYLCDEKFDLTNSWKSQSFAKPGGSLFADPKP